jgi:hypothetical protein
MTFRYRTLYQLSYNGFAKLSKLLIPLANARGSVHRTISNREPRPP